ncbi:hypothetical protein CIHG_09170 [Coccidioides immitis H538.4]|uniref:Uncharacterized protein n=2 Tax=Coccidioides immitis TaxID=5501 RepID=A0A0J8UU51_COCIT|nr:hypothetical protein CIRG_05928 [Coccidioides immitis RMSCC 2394]KMU91293.1 hypothetical protein CIHG_09170 [Coccidioides immitis H538.4]
MPRNRTQFERIAPQTCLNDTSGGHRSPTGSSKLANSWQHNVKQTASAPTPEIHVLETDRSSGLEPCERQRKRSPGHSLWLAPYPYSGSRSPLWASGRGGD